MKLFRWVWPTFLGQAVYGQFEASQNTTVFNPRSYYFESGKDIRLVTQQEYDWYRHYVWAQNVCDIYQSTDICYNFQNQGQVKSSCKQDTNYALSYRYGGSPVRPAIVGCRDPDTIGLIPNEWDATFRYYGYQSVPKRRDDQCHHSLFPHDMKTFAKCDDISYTLPKNGDVPEITLTGFYVAPYLPYFDPNKNYIGAVILAVHDGEEWYHDGKAKPWVRSARNGWNGELISARIKPGYIIMREADELVNYWSNQNYVVGRDITFHNALLGHFFDFYYPKLEDRRSYEPVSDFEREGITLIGWGFSYQAVDSKANEYFCDFKFNSYTFNAGQTINSDSNIYFEKFKDGEGNQNRVHSRLQNFIRLGVNYWRENVKDPRYDNREPLERLLRVSQINQWGKEHKWDNLLECNYENKPEPTRAPTTTTTTSTTKPPTPTKSSSPAQSPKPVQSTTASTQASPKTTKVITTTTPSSAAPASSSCEVNLIPKDRLKCHGGKMGRSASKKFGRYATIHEVKKSHFASDNVKLGRMADPRGAAFDIGAWIDNDWVLNDPIPGKTNEYQLNPQPCHPDNKFLDFFLCRADSKKLGLRAQDNKN